MKRPFDPYPSHLQVASLQSLLDIRIKNLESDLQTSKSLIDENSNDIGSSNYNLTSWINQTQLEILDLQKNVSLNLEELQGDFTMRLDLISKQEGPQVTHSTTFS